MIQCIYCWSNWFSYFSWPRTQRWCKWTKESWKLISSIVLILVLHGECWADLSFETRDSKQPDSSTDVIFFYGEFFILETGVMMTWISILASLLTWLLCRISSFSRFTKFVLVCFYRAWIETSVLLWWILFTVSVHCCFYTHDMCLSVAQYCLWSVPLVAVMMRRCWIVCWTSFVFCLFVYIPVDGLPIYQSWNMRFYHAIVDLPVWNHDN